MADRRPIPSPSPGPKYGVQLSTQATVKVLLYQIMIERGITKSQLARALHWHRPQVDRLLDIKHASRPDHIDAALQEMDARLEITIAKRRAPRRATSSNGPKRAARRASKRA